MSVPGLLHGFGVKFRDVALRSGIPPALLDDPRNRIAFVDLGRLLDECVSATACPHFALLVGHRSGIAALGAVGRLARNADSVGHALEAIVAHLHLHDRGATLSLLERGRGEVELAYLLFHPDIAGARHIAEGTLVIAMRILRTLCGPTWTPVEVTLARDEPADPSAYRQVFGRAIRFNASRFAIVFGADWLERSIPGADAKERLRVARLVTELERSQSTPISARTREVLTRLLVFTAPSLEKVARRLGVSRRTLNRHLAAEGSTYKALLEDARHALARQLLTQTRISAIDIAAVLQYTTPNAFSRAFKHWERGTTPRRARCPRTPARTGAPEAR